MNRKCNQCRRVVPPMRLPFHCACGTRHETFDELPETDRPVSRMPRHPRPQPKVPRETKVLHLLSERGAIEAEAASRGMLAGDVIAAMTKAIGWPKCGGCAKRQEWLNRAHLWVAEWLGG